MREVILLDTGPLVAWLCATDQWHEWSADQFGKLEPAFITCEAVLAEACFLYARAGGDPAKIVGKVRQGFLDATFTLATEAAAIELLMRRYSDTPISLADACLVRLSEVHKDCRVLTLDKHFNHYRRYGRSVIPLISPW
jgi:uncharacterized protein